METREDGRNHGGRHAPSETSLEGWKQVCRRVWGNPVPSFRNFLRGMETARSRGLPGRRRLFRNFLRGMETNALEGIRTAEATFRNFLRGMETGAVTAVWPFRCCFRNFLRGMETFHG